MAFFCFSPKIGALIVAILNMTIGMAIVIEYLFGRLDYMNTLSETVDKFLNDNDTLPSTTPSHPFTTPTTTTTPTPSTGQDDDKCNNWICSWIVLLEPAFFYVGFVIIFCFLLSSVVSGLASMLQTKNRKTFAYLAYLLTAALLGVTFINCLSMFVWGTHWMDLTPLFVWGCIVQIYFTLVLVDYHESSEFQAVPSE